MQDRKLYEYAVIRVMPRVEREEFMNVGVIVYCAAQKFLAAAFHVDQNKLYAIAPEIDLAVITENLTSLVNICKGGNNAGPIGGLTTPERFRWLTATRSTVIQASKVHPGFCKDPQKTLARLMDELVF